MLWRGNLGGAADGNGANWKLTAVVLPGAGRAEQGENGLSCRRRVDAVEHIGIVENLRRTADFAGQHIRAVPHGVLGCLILGRRCDHRLRLWIQVLATPQQVSRTLLVGYPGWLIGVGQMSRSSMTEFSALDATSS